MTKRIAAAAAVCLTVAAPALAAAYKQVGSASASGDFASAVASGNAKNPNGLYVATIAKPKQKVDVQWTVVCSKGMGAGSKSGGYSTRSAAKRKIRMSTSNPDSCTMSASGSLAKGGKLTVRLYKR